VRPEQVSLLKFILTAREGVSKGLFTRYQCPSVERHAFLHLVTTQFGMVFTSCAILDVSYPQEN